VDGLEARQQLRLVGRLANIVVGARLESGHHTLGGTVTRQQQDVEVSR
jgi:hypothetical protein